MSKVLDDARKTGAKVETGGERVGSEGNFFAPTVLTNVSLEADVFNNEPFGPIAAIRGFDTLEEAIAEANRLPFGLAGYAFTKVVPQRASAVATDGSRHAVDQPACHAFGRKCRLAA
jgi:NAD-dependent aldehyde dehydrogenases